VGSPPGQTGRRGGQPPWLPGGVRLDAFETAPALAEYRALAASFRRHLLAENKADGHLTTPTTEPDNAGSRAWAITVVPASRLASRPVPPPAVVPEKANDVTPPAAVGQKPEAMRSELPTLRRALAPLERA
jgi:hypothetical protein